MARTLPAAMSRLHGPDASRRHPRAVLAPGARRDAPAPPSTRSRPSRRGATWSRWASARWHRDAGRRPAWQPADRGPLAAPAAARALRRRGSACATRASSGRPARSTSSTPPPTWRRPRGARWSRRCTTCTSCTSRPTSPRRGVGVFTRFLDLVRDEAALVVCPSEATRVDCEAAGIERAPAAGHPVGDRTPPRWRPARSRGCGGATTCDRPFVLFAGTVEPRKNLRRLLEAFARARRDRRRAGGRRPRRVETTDLAATRPRVRRLGFVPERRPRRAVRRRRRRRVPEPAGGLRPPRARGDGAGRRGRHVGDDRPPRRWPATPPCWSTRSTSTPSPAALQRLLDDAELARAARRGGPGPGRHLHLGPHGRRRWSAAYRDGGRRGVTATVGVNLLWLVPGEVGGSEQSTVASAPRPPSTGRTADLDLRLFVLPVVRGGPPRGGRRRFPTEVLGRRAVTRGCARIVAESTWLARRTAEPRPRAPRRRHGAGPSHPAPVRAHPPRPPAARAPRHPRPAQARLPRARRPAGRCGRPRIVVRRASSCGSTVLDALRRRPRAGRRRSRTASPVATGRAAEGRARGPLRARRAGGALPGHHLSPQEPPHARRGLRARSSSDHPTPSSCSPGGAGASEAEVLARIERAPADPAACAASAASRRPTWPGCSTSPTWWRCRPATRGSASRPLEAMVAGAARGRRRRHRAPGGGRRRRPARRPGRSRPPGPPPSGGSWPTPPSARGWAPRAGSGRRGSRWEANARRPRRASTGGR